MRIFPTSASAVSLLRSRRAANRRKRGGRQPTLASQFKQSLNDLVSGINETAVHYVRCIKPNQNASSSEFDLQGVHEQLRCQGILEAIRIARAAYPNRLVHREIISRYAFCLYDDSLAKPGGAVTEEKIRKTSDAKRKAELLMQALNLDTSTYQIGRTKVFFRRVALEEMEASRGRVVDRKLTKLQAAVRRMIYRKRFVEMRVAAITVQARGRAFSARRSFVRLRAALIRIQCVCRVINARKELYRRRYGVAATKIQTRIRLVIYRGKYVRLRAAAIIVQREARRYNAMRSYVIALKEAKEEAKMVNIVNRLQERLAEEMKCREAAEARLAEVAAFPEDDPDGATTLARLSMSSAASEEDGDDSRRRVKELEAQVKELEASLARKDEELAQTQTQLQERGEQLAEAQVQLAAVEDGGDGTDRAEAVSSAKDAIGNAVSTVRAELQLRLDAQEAELQASRVARLQIQHRLGEMERSENTRTRRLELELRKVRGELEEVGREREEADGSLRDEHVRSLEQQLAIDRAEAASAKAAANSATEDLARYSTELLDVTRAHEDVGALVKQTAAFQQQLAAQTSELERLRSDSIQSATLLAEANKQLRLARMQGSAESNDAGNTGWHLTSEVEQELTQQLGAQRAELEAAAEAATAANRRATQLQEAEAVRSSQLTTQLKQHQEELELLRRDQEETGRKLANAVAEAAAASASAGGGASVQDAIAAARAAVESTTDARLAQVEQQLQAKAAELQSALSRAEFSEQELRDATASRSSAEQAQTADAARHEALEKELSLLSSQVEARQAEVTSLRAELAAKEMELTVAQAEAEVATGEHAAGEHAAQAMAALMADTRLKDLEAQLQARQTQLEEVQARCAALREQVAAAEQQDGHRSELVAQNQRQQEELHNMRQEQLEMGKKLAASLGEVAAAAQASGDPTAVLSAVKEAREAATAAAEEQLGSYDKQLQDLQDQLKAKDAETEVLQASAKKKLEEAVSAQLGQKVASEAHDALESRNSQLESQLKLLSKEVERLQGETVGGDGSSAGAEELGQQLAFTRAELEAERQAHAQARDNLTKIEKSAGDMQLLNHSPARGAGKKVAEELLRAQKAVEAKDKTLEQHAKKELAADRKQAELASDKIKLQTSLDATKSQVRKMVGEIMGITQVRSCISFVVCTELRLRVLTCSQEVSRLERTLGLPNTLARQSSKDLPKRLQALSARLRAAAQREDEVADFERELLYLGKKLQDADVEVLFTKLHLDQKELLRISNTVRASASTPGATPAAETHRVPQTIKGVNMSVHKLRARIVAVEKELEQEAQAAAAVVVSPSQSPARTGVDEVLCWDVPQHVLQRAGLSHGLVDAIIDASNLRKNLNDLTWELCKPGCAPNQPHSHSRIRAHCRR